MDFNFWYSMRKLVSLALQAILVQVIISITSWQCIVKFLHKVNFYWLRTMQLMWIKVYQRNHSPNVLNVLRREHFQEQETTLNQSNESLSINKLRILSSKSSYWRLKSIKSSKILHRFLLSSLPTISKLLNSISKSSNNTKVKN